MNTTTISKSNINSSLVRDFAWTSADGSVGTLRVTLSNDAIYDYDGVPVAVAKRLEREGNSVGRFFNASIRNEYSATCIRGASKR